MSRSSTFPLEQPYRQQSGKISRTQPGSQTVSGKKTQGLPQSQASNGRKPTSEPQAPNGLNSNPQPQSSSGRKPAPQSQVSTASRKATPQSQTQASSSHKPIPQTQSQSIPGQWNSNNNEPPQITTTVTGPPQQPPRSHSPFSIPKVPIRHHHAQYTQQIDRPSLGSRQDSIQTRYVTMLLEVDDIPRMHNILASFFTWILLAGFIIFPGTYTTLTTSSTLSSSAAGTLLLTTIKHTKLLIVGALCSGIGSLGMLYLFYLHHTNYIWLIQRIFLPGTMNSLMGMISTLVSVYAQNHGVWSVTARVTGSVIGGCLVGTGGLFVVYNFWVLRRVRKEHQRVMGEEREGEGWKEKVERKAGEKSFGGVV